MKSKIIAILCLLPSFFLLIYFFGIFFEDPTIFNWWLFLFLLLFVLIMFLFGILGVINEFFKLPSKFNYLVKTFSYISAGCAGPIFLFFLYFLMRMLLP